MTKKKRKKMKQYELLLETERENIDLSKKHYEKELNSYIECLNLLADTHTHLCDILEKGTTSVQACVLLNCGRILGSLGAYIDLLMKGYYFDANIIQRSLIENVYLIECFVKDEKYADKWVKRELKLSEIKEELGLYSDEKFTKYWNRICDYVHVNIPAVLSLHRIREKPIVDIFHVPRFRSNPDIALMFFPVIGIMTLILLTTAFGNLMNRKVKTQIAKFLEKWQIEVVKLCDRVLKESEKTSSK